MEFEFECVCGERVSEFTRGPRGEVPGLSLACDHCDARYVVTISLLTEGNHDGPDSSMQ